MGGSTPRVAPPVVTPTPKIQDRAVQDTIAEAVRRRSRGRGYRSTILSKQFMDDSSKALQETFGA